MICMFFLRLVAIRLPGLSNEELILHLNGSPYLIIDCRNFFLGLACDFHNEIISLAILIMDHFRLFITVTAINVCLIFTSPFRKNVLAKFATQF